ncbi:putative omega-hydroxypalmitate O-feruloyl transferase [Medicago truncatula]|uniref:HXXXD-type acyl-transferase family protein n=1 Tax=Medicago truncatula TaxID=3880 RepID=A0A072VU57_MEDTR|nr:omega-hydroxypalmitate O-feruloyl transferase [Medicago truncatula]KEH41650.1 HXXXD-type acyl-transferase family protein [Medicago truncatula]RHN74100.1 putative omega-hydroxypalmitate O-feruloyl transferase [Medicago truncatula]
MAPPWVQELPLNPLNIPVTIINTFSVTPSKPIPVKPGDCLYLSNLDDVIGARVFTPTVYFYQSDNSSTSFQKPVAEILGRALADVLVPYYPLSGRLRETKNGKLEVFFGEEEEQGALMVEARSNIALSELGDFAAPNPSWEPLIFKFPNEEQYKVLEMPLVIAQVTIFTCGGFSLGLRLCHCICDGMGAMQFLGAWAATAKTGKLVTEPEPCWNREIFKPRDPPEVKFPHMEFMRIDEGSNLTMKLWKTKPVQKCYRIRREFQNQLKSLAQPFDSAGCTTFDAMAAHIWRSWVKALDVKPQDYELRLTFSVNARQKLKNPPLKEGFYGNVVCIACTTSKVSDLVNGKLPETTLLVREARQSVTEEYLRSTVDYVEVDRPKQLEFGGKLTITQWTRFSIYNCSDFGWGKPIYAGPIDLTPTPQVCVFLPEGEGDSSGGSMIVCICLPESAANKFTQALLIDSVLLT